MNDEARPRATSASIELRVERLEGQMSGALIELALIKQGQLAQNSLVTALIAQFNGLAGELRQFLTAAAAQSAEPQATPAGRALLAALNLRDVERERQHGVFERGITAARAEAEAAKDEAIKGRMLMASLGGAVGVILFLTNLFAPAIRQVLGLP